MGRITSDSRRLRDEQGGLSTLEWLGVVSMIALLLLMIPFVREAAQDVAGAIFNRHDEAGHLTDFSQAMRGIGITVGSVAVFIGAGWFILYTDLGLRLSFLVTGAALLGWMTIGGAWFVAYAPRGVRRANLEGLNALQMRIPAIAMTLGSLILFAMFVIALDRYERDEPA